MDKIPDDKLIWESFPFFRDIELECIPLRDDVFECECDECLANDWHQDFTQCEICKYNEDNITTR